MLILLLLESAFSQQCRSLVLSGGGSYGAFESGVISSLVYNLPMQEVQYDAVVGISAGAINSLGFSQFPKGQEQEAARYLAFTWRALNNKSSILKRWKGGLLAGLLFHSSLIDSSPEHATLTRMLKSQIVRKISVGTTNLDTGDYAVFQEDIGMAGMINATMCSSAIPGIFSVQHFNGSNFVDGFVRYHMDVITGVKRCLEVTNEANITVDMVSCSPTTLPVMNVDFKTIDVIQRADQIRAYQNDVKHLDEAIQAYPNVNYRYYIKPTEDLPGEIPLDFRPVSIEKSIKIGYSDAKKIIESGKTAREVLKEMKTMQVIFP